MPNSPELAYLLDLRLKTRGNPAGRALVDRCIALVARAETAGATELRALELEVAAIADELAERYGAPWTAELQ